jgi:hypothetical protein
LGIIAPFGEMCGVCKEAELLAESCAHHSRNGNCALELVAVAHVQKDIEPGAASTAAMGNDCTRPARARPIGDFPNGARRKWRLTGKF